MQGKLIPLNIDKRYFLSSVHSRRRASTCNVYNEIDDFVGLFCYGAPQDSTPMRYTSMLVHLNGLLLALEKPGLHSNFEKKSEVFDFF